MTDDERKVLKIVASAILGLNMGDEILTKEERELLTAWVEAE